MDIKQEQNRFLAAKIGKIKIVATIPVSAVQKAALLLTYVKAIESLFKSNTAVHYTNHNNVTTALITTHNTRY